MIGPAIPIDPWLAAVALIMAAWRVTSLITTEDGPWNVLQRVRRLLGAVYYPDGKLAITHGPVAELITCVWCTSVWIAPLLVLLWWLAPVAVVALAISAGVILLDRIVAK